MKGAPAGWLGRRYAVGRYGMMRGTSHGGDVWVSFQLAVSIRQTVARSAETCDFSVDAVSPVLHTPCKSTSGALHLPALLRF